jgi:hypothetical protein
MKAYGWNVRQFKVGYIFGKSGCKLMEGVENDRLVN